jgi:hypothetical protein
MRLRVENYPASAVERAMKLEEVLLRATAGKIMWWHAAEISVASHTCCVTASTNNMPPSNKSPQ